MSVARQKHKKNTTKHTREHNAVANFEKQTILGCCSRDPNDSGKQSDLTDKQPRPKRDCSPLRPRPSAHVVSKPSEPRLQPNRLSRGKKPQWELVPPFPNHKLQQTTFPVKAPHHSRITHLCVARESNILTSLASRRIMLPWLFSHFGTFATAI